jgi:hypothetical protein
MPPEGRHFVVVFHDTTLECTAEHLIVGISRRFGRVI